jgi:hypothetical protein
MSIPKTDPTDNTKKDPDEWVSGDDPMTGAQAAYLKTLCEQAWTSELYDDNLTKAEASKLIDERYAPFEATVVPFAEATGLVFRL